MSVVSHRGPRLWAARLISPKGSAARIGGLQGRAPRRFVHHARGRVSRCRCMFGGPVPSSRRFADVHPQIRLAALGKNSLAMGGEADGGGLWNPFVKDFAVFHFSIKDGT